jgi:hypothetical protein
MLWVYFFSIQKENAEEDCKRGTEFAYICGRKSRAKETNTIITELLIDKYENIDYILVFTWLLRISNTLLFCNRIHLLI